MGHEVHGNKHSRQVPLMDRTSSPLLCTNPVIDQLSSWSSCSDGRTDVHLAKGVFSKVWLLRQKRPRVVCHFFKGHLYLSISLLSSPSHDCIAFITIIVYHINAGTICNVHEHLQCSRILAMFTNTCKVYQIEAGTLLLVREQEVESVISRPWMIKRLLRAKICNRHL